MRQSLGPKRVKDSDEWESKQIGNCCAGLVQVGDPKTGRWGEKLKGKRKAKIALSFGPEKTIAINPPPSSSATSPATSSPMTPATAVPAVMPVPATLAPSQARTWFWRSKTSRRTRLNKKTEQMWEPGKGQAWLSSTKMLIPAWLVGAEGWEWLVDFLVSVAVDTLFTNLDSLTLFCVSKFRICSKILSKYSSVLVPLACSAFRLFMSMMQKEP